MTFFSVFLFAEKNQITSLMHAGPATYTTLNK